MSKPKSLVNKATTDDRKPPPGFILQELAKKTHSIDDCNTIEELVLKKLDKNKAYVKYKALRIIKYICEHGSPAWRRNWKSHTGIVRQCAQFRGPTDPVYGDSPNEDVRKAAKEAMTAIFASITSGHQSVKTRTSKGIEGGGNYDVSSNSNTSKFSKIITFPNKSPGTISTPDMHDAPRVGTFSSGRSMEGMGNTSYKPKKNTGPFKPLESNTNTYTSVSLDNPHSGGKLNNRISRRNLRRKKQQVGGNWDDSDDDEEEETNNNNNNDSYDYNEDSNDDEFRSEDNPRKHETQYHRKRSQNKKSDGLYESNWVNKITSGGGIGFKIPNVEQYVQQFENLSQSHVLEFLDEKFASNSWQTRAKALTLIKCILEKGSNNSKNNINNYFIDSNENLEELLNDKKSQIRKLAQNVWDLCGLDNVEEEEEEEEEATQNQKPIENNNKSNNETSIIDFNDMTTDTQPKQQTSNFLDDLLDDTPNTNTTTNNTNNNNNFGLDTSNNNTGGSLFEGMNINNTNQNENQASNNNVSLFSGMDVNNDTQNDNMFTGLNTNENQQIITNNSTTNNNNNNNNNDVFGDILTDTNNNQTNNNMDSNMFNLGNSINSNSQVDNSNLFNLGNNNPTNNNQTNNSSNLFNLGNNNETTSNNINNQSNMFNLGISNTTTSTTSNPSNLFNLQTNTNTNTNSNQQSMNNMFNQLSNTMNLVQNQHNMNMNMMNNMNTMNNMSSMNNMNMFNMNNNMNMNNRGMYGYNNMNRNYNTNNNQSSFHTVYGNNPRSNDPFRGISSNTRTTTMKPQPKQQNTGTDPFQDLVKF